jgi:hypothetical protein
MHIPSIRSPDLSSNLLLTFIWLMRVALSLLQLQQQEGARRVLNHHYPQLQHSHIRQQLVVLIIRSWFVALINGSVARTTLLCTTVAYN